MKCFRAENIVISELVAQQLAVVVVPYVVCVLLS